MANSPKTESDRQVKDHSVDNPADVNDTPDFTALKPKPKKKIGRPRKSEKPRNCSTG